MFLIIVIGCNNVDSTLCGELPKEYKENLKLAEKIYSNDFEIKSVPCEFSFLNVYMKSSELDTCELIALQSIICRTKRKQVWSAIDLYDNKGNYLFTRHKNGTISKVEHR